jgi:SAM-dependent methyltransferase
LGTAVFSGRKDFFLGEEGIMNDNEARVPLTYSKEWVEDFYEQEDPWGVNKHKRLRQRALRAFNVLGQRHFNLGIDLGCGEGTITVDILSRYCDRVLGMDYSKKAVQRAKEKASNASNVEFMNADMRELDFCKIGLAPDLVFCSDAFQFLNRSQQRDLIARIGKLTVKPKILLVIPLLFKKYWFEHPERVNYEPGYEFYDTWDELREIAKGGYVIKKIEPVMDHVPRTVPWGDNIISAFLRKAFYFLFVKVLSRSIAPWSAFEQDEMRFRLLRWYYKWPVLNWIIKRFILYYSILLEPRIGIS